MLEVYTICYFITILTLCPLGIFSCYFVVCWFFSKSTFLKNSSRNTIWVSNRVDPDQTWHPVGPELGPICLQRLWAEDTNRQWLKHPSSGCKMDFFKIKVPVSCELTLILSWIFLFSTLYPVNLHHCSCKHAFSIMCLFIVCCSHVWYCRFKDWWESL